MDAGNGGVVRLETNQRTDKEVAADLRARMTAKLVEVAMILDEANRSGMRIAFQLGIDGFGRNVVTTLDIVKPL